jgi:hypothetical protein
VNPTLNDGSTLMLFHSRRQRRRLPDQRHLLWRCCGRWAIPADRSRRQRHHPATAAGPDPGRRPVRPEPDRPAADRQAQDALACRSTAATCCWSSARSATTP